MQYGTLGCLYKVMHEKLNNNIPDTKWPPVDADVTTENNIHTYIIYDYLNIDTE